MKKDYFLRWIGFGVFALIIWLFLPFLKSFFVASLMVMATFPIYYFIETKIKQYEKLKTLALRKANRLSLAHKKPPLDKINFLC